MDYRQFDNYLKNFEPNNRVLYQARIGGFLAERLFTLWLSWKKLKVVNSEAMQWFEILFLFKNSSNTLNINSQYSLNNSFFIINMLNVYNILLFFKTSLMIS